MLFTSGLSLIVALTMQNRIDELATIVNFGALAGFSLLHLSVLVHFGIRKKSRKIFLHWVVPILGLVVVLAVFSGMSRLALWVGCCWILVGGLYGMLLHARRRDEIRAPL